jgi:hypothetical protein
MKLRSGLALSAHPEFSPLHFDAIYEIDDKINSKMFFFNKSSHLQVQFIYVEGFWRSTKFY